ncbi:DUF4198 domain-containing protein [uncultured Turicimonas sp.]|uniref:DUF4198 domain-containing protein n=1 Tax=uncultured Turicimonas sp. TaxID=1918607 RepID=UPI0028053726|nr:DUF4198 domain-containing protein [uncultured Turicimonas sp.]
MIKFPALFAALIFSASASAHFGSVLPDKQIVENQKDNVLTLTAAFNHPMEQTGMTMDKPQKFSVFKDNQAQDLTSTLKPATVLGKDAWTTQYKISRPGLYQFLLEPAPYWEPAEDKFIIHYSKLYVPAYGVEEGWENPLGVKTEIVPLTRPFGNYVGNLFRGKVLVDGKPAANTPVEVEFYNKGKTAEAPNDIFVTQTVMTDEQGIFSYSVPWAGWWGFAALTDADYQMKKDGADKDVELGAVLWTEFVSPKLKK